MRKEYTTYINFSSQNDKHISVKCLAKLKILHNNNDKVLDSIFDDNKGVRKFPHFVSSLFPQKCCIIQVSRVGRGREKPDTFTNMKAPP